MSGCSIIMLVIVNAQISTGLATVLYWARLAGYWLAGLGPLLAGHWRLRSGCSAPLFSPPPVCVLNGFLVGPWRLMFGLCLPVLVHGPILRCRLQFVPSLRPPLIVLWDVRLLCLGSFRFWLRYFASSWWLIRWSLCVGFFRLGSGAPDWPI